MTNTTKEKRFTLQLVNVKLQSSTRSGPEAYISIFEEIHKQKISVKVHGGKNAILRTQFKDKIEQSDILYGNISKFTVIDGKDWINLESMEVEHIEVPANKFPNLVETSYLFLPSIHRFVIVKTQSVSIKTIETFLNEAISKVILPDEEFKVIIEQSEDEFNNIFNAEEVYRLLISISYTNADTGDDNFSFMDQQLKNSSIGNFKIEATPDHKNTINTETKLINGALKLAKSNGFVDATIKKNGRRTRIQTQQHPEEIPIKCEEPLLRRTIFIKLMEKFRGNAN